MMQKGWLRIWVKKALCASASPTPRHGFRSANNTATAVFTEGSEDQTASGQEWMYIEKPPRFK